MALLRHYFSLRLSRGPLCACTSFIAYGGSNAISKPGKRIEGLRSKWVMVDAGRIHPRLILPAEQPASSSDWCRAELMDPRTKLVLEKMDADLRPVSTAAAKLSGALLLREFLEHQVAPLREHSLPLWRLGEADAAIRLSSGALADEDMVAAPHSLVGGDVARLEGAPVPLFL